MTAVVAINPTTRTVSAGRDESGQLHVRFMHAALCNQVPIPMSGGFPLDDPEMCGACRAAYQEMSKQ